MSGALEMFVPWGVLEIQLSVQGDPTSDNVLGRVLVSIPVGRQEKCFCPRGNSEESVSVPGNGERSVSVPGGV